MKNIVLLITDFCNQSCPFCFAREEMKSPLKREIGLEDLKLLVKKLKRNDIFGIHVAGGEPTLHPQFPKIFRYLMKNFLFISLVTNGIFSESVSKFLFANASRYIIQFNISTPSFIFNKKVRQLVMNRIRQFLPVTAVAVSVTDPFLDVSNVIRIFDFFDDDILKSLTIRLAVQAPIAGDKNIVSLDEFPRIGSNFCNIITYLDRRGPPSFIFSCRGMITPCMFTEAQREFLAKRGILKNGFMNEFHCHTKGEPCWFTVNPALETFHCYQRSTQDRFQIKPDTDIRKIKDSYDSLYEEYQKKFILEKCKSCPFYGLGSGKCSGPCLAFRMNALRDQDKTKMQG